MFYISICIQIIISWLARKFFQKTSFFNNPFFNTIRFYFFQEKRVIKYRINVISYNRIFSFQGLSFEKTQLAYHPELVIECLEVDIFSSDVLGKKETTLLLFDGIKIQSISRKFSRSTLRNYSHFHSCDNIVIFIFNTYILVLASLVNLYL